MIADVRVFRAGCAMIAHRRRHGLNRQIASRDNRRLLNRHALLRERGGVHLLLLESRFLRLRRRRRDREQARYSRAEGKKLWRSHFLLPFFDKIRPELHSLHFKRSPIRASGAIASTPRHCWYA